MRYVYLALLGTLAGLFLRWLTTPPPLPPPVLLPPSPDWELQLWQCDTDLHCEQLEFWVRSQWALEAA